jgi:hypothetical protein
MILTRPQDVWDWLERMDVIQFVDAVRRTDKDFCFLYSFKIKKAVVVGPGVLNLVQVRVKHETQGKEL